MATFYFCPIQQQATENVDVEYVWINLGYVTVLLLLKVTSCLQAAL